MKVVLVGELDMRDIEELRGTPVVVLTGPIEDIQRCGAVLYQDVEVAQRWNHGRRWVVRRGEGGRYDYAATVTGAGSVIWGTKEERMVFKDYTSARATAATSPTGRVVRLRSTQARANSISTDTKGKER